MDSGKPTPNQAAATTYRHCFACRYFHVGQTQCRRWPPDAHPITGDIGWPFVEADDWCGEFESRETPPRYRPPVPLEHRDTSFQEHHWPALCAERGKTPVPPSISTPIGPIIIVFLVLMGGALVLLATAIRLF